MEEEGPICEYFFSKQVPEWIRQRRKIRNILSEQENAIPITEEGNTLSEKGNVLWPKQRENTLSV